MEPGEGDLSAVSLFRVFARNYDRGGRLYGGWWINVPKAERRLITMDGEPTTELDFVGQHVAMLYARVKQPLVGDPYEVPGLEAAGLRDLGKATFNRLLNREPVAGRPATLARPDRKHRHVLPTTIEFPAYVQRLTQHLSPISQWFGMGEGVRLQREDSDLAIAVLDRLDQQGIAALPVHDSFIVKQQHETALHDAMRDCFKERYGVDAEIRTPNPDHPPQP
ncbi:hypothetical protein SAMN06295912_10391 [Sphingomonas laterariae]|uniref:DNA polymerase family A n=1 Tax=Edaphosphingomonas laterariae TaxID=861865 RepID=A0A239CXJ2_9SPHN|nr:hypothetical protein [Sphingomonas laterariae]SNS24602.1 hypothetical protein SAMN06295912_10391 [Sphingomonas laterariae]